jgi:hypothetical protein
LLSFPRATHFFFTFPKATVIFCNKNGLIVFQKITLCDTAVF